jgi:hypothetical protein
MVILSDFSLQINASSGGSLDSGSSKGYLTVNFDTTEKRSNAQKASEQARVIPF